MIANRPWPAKAAPIVRGEFNVTMGETIWTGYILQGTLWVADIIEPTSIIGRPNSLAASSSMQVFDAPVSINATPDLGVGRALPLAAKALPAFCSIVTVTCK